MHRTSIRLGAAVGLVVAALGGISSGLGLLARGDGTFQAATSVRGQAYEVATNGVYAWSGRQLVAEGIGWDAFTLFVAVPALVLAVVLVARGSFRGRLFAIGVLGYFLYQYLEYALAWAFGPLFLVHVATYGLSLVGIALVGGSLAGETGEEAFGATFPHRAWAALSTAFAAFLAVAWLGRVAAGLGGDLATAGLAGETTLVVQALDLGLVVPLLLISAALAWRRTPFGRVLATVVSVAFVAMAAAIASMLVSASWLNGRLEPAPIAAFGLAALASAILSVRMFGAAREAPGRRQARTGLPRPVGMGSAG